MDSDELKVRSREFGIRIIRLVESLPRSQTSNVVGRQLLRSGTSVGANYRAACRARSRLDFISKVGIAIEEADESLYWMEILVQAAIVPAAKLADLMDEADQLVRILTASAKTARANLKSQSRPRA